MEPIKFDEQNFRLTAPRYADHLPDNVNGIDPLYAWTDGTQVVSCWKLSIKDKVMAVLFGRIWLNVLVKPNRFPPVSMEISKKYFKHS